MQSKHNVEGEEPHLLPPKKDQGLRRVYSDGSTEANTAIKDPNPTISSNEVERVDCVCCGMSEDCTPDYISKTREFFCGQWVCGLCSEAVTEKMKRAPAMAVDGALESHIALCEQFRISRLNPKLTLAGAMRDIARRSSQHRSAKAPCAPKIARTISCGPRMELRPDR